MSSPGSDKFGCSLPLTKTASSPQPKAPTATFGWPARPMKVTEYVASMAGQYPELLSVARSPFSNAASLPIACLDVITFSKWRGFGFRKLALIAAEPKASARRYSAAVRDGYQTTSASG